MSQELYKVVFKGEVAPDKSVAEVKQALASLMQARVFQLETLFSGQPIVVKKNLSHDIALKYVMAFQDIGAVAELKPQGSANRPAAPATAQATELAMPTLSEAEPDRYLSDQPPPYSTTEPPLSQPAPASSSRFSTEDSVVENHAYANTYNDSYNAPERPFLEGIGFVIKLILTLIFTGLVVAAMVIGLLWLTSGLELIGIETLDQLLERLRQAIDQLIP